MRVTKITVTKLFGIFDHEIPLNLDDRITIIHGPNGFGKTIILRMLHGLFNGLYAIFFSIPFESFRVDFDDNASIWLDKKSQDDLQRINLPNELDNHEDKRSNKQIVFPEIKFYLLQSGELNPKSFSSKYLYNETKTPIPIETTDEILRRWHIRVSLPGKNLCTYDDIDRFDSLLDDAKAPEWWLNFQKSINIWFIQTQRLQNIITESDLSSIIVGHRKPTSVFTVEEYAKELKEGIQRKLAESASLSQSLDRTFPERLIWQMDKKDNSKLTTEEIGSKLKELEGKRTRLIEAGLLDEEMGPSFSLPKAAGQQTRDVLAVYAEDVEKKLSVFDDIANKINLFKRMIKKRFLYKEITISKEEGFYFTTPDGKILSLRALSSGEQHELVLLYQLLFKTEPDTLVLINEPEISLHVAWQVEFLKDLQEIVKLAKIDVLLATHSPQIVHDRWDLTVKLGEPLVYAEASHTE